MTSKRDNERRFRPYPDYKPSGVEWLGEIPEHWEIVPVKHLTGFHIGWTPPSGRDEYYGGENLWANISDLGPTFLFNTAKTISERGINESRVTISPKGALLFSFKLTLGLVSIAGVDMYTNEAIATFFKSPALDTSYLFWAAPIYLPRNARFNIYGAPLLNTDLIKNAKLACAPVPEQRAIAAFLDGETAKIDALVAKKERLVELLEEKRTALISSAVTRGLEPNVKMKDSGVEWLGEIPGHWEVRKLKQVSSVQFSSVDKHTIEGEATVRLCNYTDVYQNERITGNIEFMEATATVAEITKFVLKKDQVLLTKDSESWDDIAVPAFVPSGLKGVLCGYHLAVVTPMAAIIDGEYLFRAFLSREINYQFRIAATGITRYGFSKYSLDNGLFLLPPVSEQRAIAPFLDRETAKIDALVEKVREGVEKLKEYRTALISAAVTGKIDVRN